jgi:uncharacterized membrane protein YkoI
MTRKLKGALLAGAAIAAIAGGGAAIAGATGAGDGSEDAAEGPDKAITGSALDRAKAAALDHTGGGRVTGTEVDDEESYYEVEVTLENGDQVDVQLDEDFRVVGSESDGQGDEDD